MNHGSTTIRPPQANSDAWLWVRLLAAGVCISALSAAFAGYQGPFPSLVGNSPFGREVKLAPPPEPSSTVELRGFVVENGETVLSIAVTPPNGRPRSAWLEIGGSAYNVQVVGFDPATETASVKIEGRAMQLSLKKALVQLLATSSTAQNQTVKSPAQPQLSTGLSNDERQRSSEVVREIHRRRTERQNAKT